MKHQVYFGLAIRIILLCAAAMAVTYITPELHSFLGDVPQNCNNNDGVDKCWDWGIRHYWYQVMTIALFILSLVNAVMGAVKCVTKHYPEL